MSIVAAFRKLLLLAAGDQLFVAAFNRLPSLLPVDCCCRLAAAVASTEIIEELVRHGATAAEFAELDSWTAFHVRQRIIYI